MVEEDAHLSFSMSVVYVLTTPMPEDGGDNLTVEQVRKRAKWDNDYYVCRGLIFNGMFDYLFDVYQNVKTSKELWDTLKAKYMAEDASSKKVQDNEKLKGNNVAGPSVANMVEHKNSSRYNDNKGKHKHHDTRADPNKKPKMTCWKCGKPGHLKWDCKAGIKCNFVGYAEHSKAFRFYVIEPNDSIAINSIIESMGVIFNENRFSSVPKPSQRSLVKGTKDFGGLVVPRKVTDEDDPKTFDEAMKSQNVAFWKEIINDEIDSIMGNNTWVLADLPPGCRPLGCKWICKRKLKVDGTIEKFKARLVIQGFKQDSKIYYFDTYALVARIITIRLLIAMASIYSLIIHQMDVKTAFLNGELEEDVYEPAFGFHHA
nr:hypothetical protein [Tanacetum cinerariifolium]